MRPDHSSYTGDFILIDSIAYSPSTASPSTALGKLAKKIRASNRIGCRWLCATLFAVFCLASANVSHAEDRFALLIGNAEYVEGSRLTNPERDVDALASTLGKLGFQVSAVKNVDQEGFDDALNDFERRLTSGSIAVFFYAGHGFQVDGENYLLPLRHGIESKREVRRKCISVSEIVGMLEESRCNLRIVVLDACRNNPFERSWSRSDSVEGFTAVVPPDGTIIAFATAPGEVASDGRDGNSPFTKSLIKTFDSASKNPIEIQRLFRLVGQECSREANQRPYINADASMKDYLLGAIGSENQTPQPKSSPTGAPSSPPESPPTPLAESNNIAPTMVTSLPKSPEMPSAKPTTPNPDRGPRLGVLCIASLSGPIVVSVAPESPAASCRFVSNPATTYALSVGDQIKKINGIDVSDGAEFTRAVTQSPAVIRMTVKRPSGQILELTTQLNGPKQLKKTVNYPTRVGIAKSILMQTGLVIGELSQPVGVKITGVISNSVASRIQAESLPGTEPTKVAIARCGAITHINSHRVKTMADADRVVSNEWERMKQNNLPKLLVLNLIDREGKEYLCHFSD